MARFLTDLSNAVHACVPCVCVIISISFVEQQLFARIAFRMSVCVCVSVWFALWFCILVTTLSVRQISCINFLEAVKFFYPPAISFNLDVLRDCNILYICLNTHFGRRITVASHCERLFWKMSSEKNAVAINFQFKQRSNIPD